MGCLLSDLNAQFDDQATAMGAHAELSEGRVGEPLGDGEPFEATKPEAYPSPVTATTIAPEVVAAAVADNLNIVLRTMMIRAANEAYAKRVVFRQLGIRPRKLLEPLSECVRRGDEAPHFVARERRPATRRRAARAPARQRSTADDPPLGAERAVTSEAVG
jgi:hypothetical protein